MLRKAHNTAINSHELRSHQTSLHRSPRFHPSTKSKSRKKPKNPLTQLPSLLISPNPSSPHNCSTKCPDEPPSTRIATSAAAHPIGSEPTILTAHQEFDVSPIKKTHLVFSPDSAVAASTTHTRCLVKSRIDPSMWQRRSSRMASLAVIMDSSVADSATNSRCLVKSRIDPSKWERRASRMVSLEATILEVSPIKKIHLGFSPEIAVEGSRAGKRSARIGLGETVETRKAKGRRRGAGSVKVSEKEVSPIKKIHLGFSPEIAAEGSRAGKRSARIGLGETVETRKAKGRRRGVGSVKVSEKEVSPIKKIHLGFSPENAVEGSRVRKRCARVGLGETAEVRKARGRRQGKGSVKVSEKEVSPIKKLLEFSPDSAIDDSQAERGFSEKGQGRGMGLKGSVKVSPEVDAGIGEVGAGGLKGRGKNGSPLKKARKVEENCGEVCELPRLMKVQEKAGSRRGEEGECYGVQGWTKDQEAALQRAYLAAKPSPHFWKKVSKMVPGKTAQDCFDRIHADCATPTQPQPRPRASRTTFSPITNFTLPDSTSVGYTAPKARRLTSNKKKNLVALKTARHLLQKHCQIDQGQEADLFSVLEPSASPLSLSLSDIGSPATPNCISSPPSVLQKCGERSSSVQSRPFSRSKSRLRPEYASPEVLKQIKNVALHEKYIDLLHCREAKRRTIPKASSSLATREVTTTDVGFARNALICEARDVVSQFQDLQANGWGNLEGEDIDEDDAGTTDDDDEE